MEGKRKTKCIVGGLSCAKHAMNKFSPSGGLLECPGLLSSCRHHLV